MIVDEIGRGTTPEDGIALAYGCLHHLYHTNRCRTLFATHFHVLADMSAPTMEDLTCYCTDVVEDAGEGEEGLDASSSSSSSSSFSYIHRLKPGVNRQSHALKVAKLAGTKRKTKKKPLFHFFLFKRLIFFFGKKKMQRPS